MRCFALLSILTLLCANVCAEDSLQILPQQIQLHGDADMQQIVVISADENDQSTAQLDFKLTSSNPDVAIVKRSKVLPVANGEATITASHQGQTATANVTVTGMDAPHPWSFRHDVQPVLAKLGCNSGACHGALAGKGGFRLSLRGYDDTADYHTITREARGRRIELADPGRSLLLAKPTGALAHKGGVRFEVDDEAYDIISGWVAQGAKAPGGGESDVSHIEVLPEQSLLSMDAQHDLLVLAHYTDGRIRDVTRFAIFSATNEAVATVDESGKLTVVGPGEGAVVAWFASKVKLARVTSPYANEVPANVFTDAPKSSFIDELVLDQLQKLRLPPSPRCDDATFIRRAYIDTIGTLPTVEETNAFLANTSPDKREKLIDALLQRPEFVDYWTHKWCDVLLVNGKLLRPAAVKAYYQWIREQVEANRPWDEFARDVVTARGKSTDNGATNFYAVHQTPEDMTENVSQAFLGLSIGCAKCHNHPLEKWTNDQYYAMANMFARVRAKGWGGDPRNGDGVRTLIVADAGELIQPSTNKPQPPTPLDGKPLAFDDPTDRRIALAHWLTAEDNPYFARAIANRVWANFLGVGLVEQVDDLRLSNPAGNEPLLAALADHVVQSKYDLKKLMRLILLSETYQRSSLALPENNSDTRYYSHYYPRRMQAEVLHDAIVQVTGVPTKFDNTENIDGSTAKTDFYKEGTRAIQLYDSAVVSGFLNVFGRNERAITCECERSNEPTVVQVLQISNGEVVNQKLAADKSVVAKQLDGELDMAAIIDQAYLAALSREPTAEEKKQLLAIFAEVPQGERRTAIEDLYWGIMSSREFLFQH